MTRLSKILIVDDNELSRETLELLLFEQGYELLLAENGQEALQIAQESKPDLILLDVMMPEMDGFEVCERIRANPSIQTIPVILVTALDDQESRLRGIEAGADDFISKPYNRIELRARAKTITTLNRYKVLGEEREKFVQLIKLLPDGLAVINNNGEFLLTNGTFNRMVGLDENDIKEHYTFYDLIQLEDSSSPSAILAGLFKAEFSFRRFEAIFRMNVTQIPVEINAGNVIWEQNQAVQVLIRDISERKMAEREKETIMTQLYQAQKMEAIGVLVGGVTHDFNNLLSVISGYTDLALMSLQEDSPLRNHLLKMSSVAEKASMIVKQLLLFSRREEVQFSTINLNTLVMNLLKMVNRFIGEKIHIEHSFAPDLYLIDADSSNVEQIIMNLVVNARDAMTNGGKCVIATRNVVVDETVTERDPDSHPGDFVLLSISDTGTGIEKENLKKIFDPFFSTKEAGKGTGLGLSVVYGIVKRHGGWISVDSETGKGTTFHVYIPARLEGVEEGPVLDCDADTNQGKGQWVLNVEDDPVLLETSSTILEANGYQVVKAPKMQEAEEIFFSGKYSFEFIFIDVFLPDGNGVELATKIRARYSDINIFLCSGYPLEQWHSSEVENLKCNIILKPYTMKDLLRVLQEVQKN